MARLQLDDLTNAAKDAAYVSVGLSVIAFQRLQVRRNELNKALEARSGEARDALDVVNALVGDRVKMVEERLGAVLDITRRVALPSPYHRSVITVRAVVLCWNNREILPACLDHLLATDWLGGELEVVVVDNGSTDGSVADLDTRYPGVRLVETGRNLGFAGGVNAGLHDLDGVDAVALVNSDAFVDPGWLTPLVDALGADDGLGAACPKLLFAEPGADGRPVINNVGNVLGPTWELHDRGYGEPDAGQYDEPEEVWGWCGGAVLLRRLYLDDVGRFDQRLFMYAEDVDLSWKGRRRGWRYRYVPTSVVRHLGQASSGGERTPRLDHLIRRNRLVVVTRYGGWRGASTAWARALGGIASGVATQLVLPLVRRQPVQGAAWGRRVRAAWDAARLLVGGDPSLPT